MKKKLILLLVMISIGATLPVFAVDVNSIDRVSYENVIAKGCVEYGCDASVTLINLEDEIVQIENDEVFQINAGKNADRCGGDICGTDGCTFQITNAHYDYGFGDRGAWKYAYKYTEDTTDILSDIKEGISVDTTGGNGKGMHDDFIAERKAHYAGSLFTECYAQVPVAGNEYYVLKAIVNRYNVPNTRKLFTEKDEDLHLVVFDKTQMDIYVNQEITDRPNSKAVSKYKIGSIFTDGKEKASGAVEPNDGNNIGFDTDKETFLVCEGHRKCEQGHDFNVASSGEKCVQGTTYLSRYCPKETCAFIWDVTNRTNTAGANSAGIAGNAFEGLICKDKKDNNSEYCATHTCDSCKEPIIGVNINDALNEVLVYSGDSLGSYSKHCEGHFCKYIGCREAETNGTNSGSAINCTDYCTTHNNGKCGAVDCPNQAVTTYLGKYPICQWHVSNYLNNSGNGYQLKIDKIITCRCGNKSDKVTMYLENGTYICAVCKLEDVLINNENATDDDKIKVEAENELIGEGKDPGRSDWDKLLADKIEEIKEEIENGKEEVISNFSFCEKCGNLYIEKATSKGKCDKCANEKGDEGKKDTWTATLSGNPNTLIGGGDGNLTIGGISGNITTQDPTTCNHISYPVPSTVTFINLNDGTHLQSWNCTGCASLRQEKYEHYYINGICLCGQQKPSNDIPLINGMPSI